MGERADIVLFGSGGFAARILFDVAATAERPLRIAVAGRNAERLDWLKLAGNARAVVFGRPVEVAARRVDLAVADAAAEAITALEPAVVVQAASAQPPSVIAATGDAWSRLVAEGGLSATAVFNALFSVRVARAIAAARPGCRHVNCCYPDVVNSLIAALGLPVACGVGNVAILAAAFAGALGVRRPGALKVLAHYQTITPFRRPAETRRGPLPRVWIDGAEVADVARRFAGVKLTPEPVIDISGANGVPMILAIASGGACLGHAPGPNGLPGGYPVAFRDGRLDLDLPPGLGRDDAIRWNARFEEESGMVVEADGRVRYTGVLYERLRAASPDLAKGFHARDLEQVFEDMAALRARLQARA
jgi:hypothetical protein